MARDQRSACLEAAAVGINARYVRELGRPEAPAMRAAKLLAQDLTGTRKTDVAKVRDGLQIAMDGLGDERGARMQRTIMQGLHYLADPNEHRQDMLAHWANEIAEAAEDLADFIGPEDAGTDE